MDASAGQRRRGRRLVAALIACCVIGCTTTGMAIGGEPTAKASAAGATNCKKSRAKLNHTAARTRRNRCRRASHSVSSGPRGTAAAPAESENTTTTPPDNNPPAQASGLSLLRDDSASNPNPLPLWNEIAAQDSSRASWFPGGGPDNGPFRRLTVLDGDNAWGERAELGYNSRLNGLGAPWGTFFLYYAGQRRVTSYDMRLPDTFPINTNSWQVVTQMKQTGPSANSGGTPVIALEARQGRWVLTQSDSPGDSSDTHELWSTPATLGAWTHISWDVTYSPDPREGRVQLTVGDAQSPTFTTYTQKYEIAPGSQGLSPGDPIPSHLRMGLYHSPSLPGSHVDFTNVEVRG